MDRKTQIALDELEQELREDRLSQVSQQWIQQTQLQPETLMAMLDEKPNSDDRRIHLYHCDHLGTPVALTDQQGRIAWEAKLDPWGNVQEEYNPGCIEQSIRLLGPSYRRPAIHPYPLTIITPASAIIAPITKPGSIGSCRSQAPRMTPKIGVRKVSTPNCDAR